MKWFPSVGSSGTIVAGIYQGCGTCVDGTASTSCYISHPTGVAAWGPTDFIFAENDYHRVRRSTNGVISTVAGTGTAGTLGDGGPATAATLIYPGPLRIDGSGGFFISAWGGSNNAVRYVDSMGTIRTPFVSTTNSISSVPDVAGGGL